MKTYIFILGRQPALGLAELESRFGAASLQSISDEVVALSDTGQISNSPKFNEVDLNRLGSLTKAAVLLDYIDSTDFRAATDYLIKNLPALTKDIPDGKISLGVSVHGFNVPPRAINAAALSFKKVIKQSGRNARVVPNNEMFLNTAQVIHNKLTSPTGMEFLIIKSGRRMAIARTVWVQDIEAYRRRDQERPMRNSKVGMLPPKLAQIIINLALADKATDHGTTVLDPFCGTGVILQEAALMHLDVFGSDIDDRMVEYSRQNFNWLRDNNFLDHTNLKSHDHYPPIIKADATNHRWGKPFDAIACETYLGRPFSHQPDPQTLQKVVHDVNIIHKKFLENVANQTTSGFRMCVAVPAWHTKTGVKHLPVLDQLEQLGYNRVSFVHAKTEDLIYHRTGQVVGRELVVLIRK